MPLPHTAMGEHIFLPQRCWVGYMTFFDLWGVSGCDASEGVKNVLRLGLLSWLLPSAVKTCFR